MSLFKRKPKEFYLLNCGKNKCRYQWLQKNSPYGELAFIIGIKPTTCPKCGYCGGGATKVILHE